MYCRIAFVFILLFYMCALPVNAMAANSSEQASSKSDSTSDEKSAVSSPWFNEKRTANLAAVMAFSILFFVIMQRGRKGKSLYIRPIAGLDALEDAVGRAAEMGRPVIYIPGLASVSDPATVASMSILSKVAFSAARLRTPIRVPNYSPLAWPVARGVVQDAFYRAGRQDAFRPDDIPYLTSRHMTYSMAVVGMMVRDRVAANFFIGHFYSESLIFAETGAAIGAKQIGGCDSVAQLPFFITTCDYNLIGEELFAAGALVAGDSVNRSTIAAHDWFKGAIIVLVLGSVVLMLLDLAGVDAAGDMLVSLSTMLTGGGK